MKSLEEKLKQAGVEVVSPVCRQVGAQSGGDREVVRIWQEVRRGVTG
jgi:hypothetical protein